MLQNPTSSTPRRTGQDVHLEIVTGLRRLVLTEEVTLGNILGIGGYAEVYEGQLFVATTNEWKKVAVKRFRFIMSKEKEFAEVRIV